MSGKSQGGTPEWTAPEVLRNLHYNEKSDVYRLESLTPLPLLDESSVLVVILPNHGALWHVGGHYNLAHLCPHKPSGHVPDPLQGIPLIGFCIACSYGVILYELATEKEPWEDMTPMQASSF